MGKGISVGVDCANRDQSDNCDSRQYTSNHSSSIPLLSEEAPFSHKTTSSSSSHTVRRKLRYRLMGDIFYGNDDHCEMNDSMYKEDVMESMRSQRESKDLKKKRQKNWWNFRCFECLSLLRGFINF